MEYTKPRKLPKDFYQNNYYKMSKSAFQSQISEVCKTKEDADTCVQKYLKAFDSVFDTLKTKLEEEDRVAYYFDRRMYNGEGLAFFMRPKANTGYENWA